MNYYAAYRPYGVHSLNTDGPRADKYLRFPTKAARNAWVERDTAHREGLSASSPEVRRVQAYVKAWGYSEFFTAATY